MSAGGYYKYTWDDLAVKSKNTSKTYKFEVYVSIFYDEYFLFLVHCISELHTPHFWIRVKVFHFWRVIWTYFPEGSLFG